MSKKNFQRLASAFIIIIVLFIHIPSIFKDISLIVISVAIFLSTYLYYPKTKSEDNDMTD